MADLDRCPDDPLADAGVRSAVETARREGPIDDAVTRLKQLQALTSQERVQSPDNTVVKAHRTQAALPRSAPWRRDIFVRVETLTLMALAQPPGSALTLAAWRA